MSRKVGCSVNQSEQPEHGAEGPVASFGGESRARKGPGDRWNQNLNSSLARSEISHLLSRLSPADKVVLSYLTIVAGLIVASNSRVELWWLLVLGHLLVMAIIIGLARWPDLTDLGQADLKSLDGNRSRAMLVVRSWYPLILIPLTYKELGYLVPLIHPHDFDRELALIDHRILGADPIVWLDRINYPAVTLVMQLAYLTYYVAPIALGVVLWRGNQFKDFQFFLFILL